MQCVRPCAVLAVACAASAADRDLAGHAKGAKRHWWAVLMNKEHTTALVLCYAFRMRLGARTAMRAPHTTTHRG